MHMATSHSIHFRPLLSCIIRPGRKQRGKVSDEHNQQYQEVSKDLTKRLPSSCLRAWERVGSTDIELQRQVFSSEHRNVAETGRRNNQIIVLEGRTNKTTVLLNILVWS